MYGKRIVPEIKIKKYLKNRSLVERTKMSVSTMIRPMGSIEQFVDCCTISRNLNMAVAVTVQTKSKITLDILERALISLQVWLCS